MEDSQIYKILGRNIASYRSERKLKQSELADRIGLTRASLANIEAGRQRPMLHHLYNFVEALKLDSITDLLPARLPDSLRPKSKRKHNKGEKPEVKFVGKETLSIVEKAQVESVLAKAINSKSPRRQ